MAATATQTSASADVVCVLNSDLLQVFENARPVKAVVKEEAKTMDHPLETGSTITDHRIILPIEIEFSLVIAVAEYREVYQQVKALFLQAELLTVQTRTGSYPNMLIAAMPHDEDTDMMDAVSIAVKFKEAHFVQPKFTTLKVRKPKNSSTVKRGEQQTTNTSTTRKGSILGSIFGK